MPYRLLTIGLALLLAAHLHAQPEPTRLLTQPTLSADHVVFVYANDLWIADRDGSNPRRLTIDPGQEEHPVLSADGQTIAFTGEYDGNTDVFTVPVTGGVPQRMTWHPEADVAYGFTPDGQSLLFISPRLAANRGQAQVFTVPLAGGPASALSVPTAFDPAYSPDGRYLAYNPLPPAFTQWKNYRGGRMSRIWIQNLRDQSVTEIPRPEGGSNDVQPQWIDGRVYFRSDRGGEFNLFAYDPGSREVEQLTSYTDFPVEDLGSGAGQLVFEQAGYLHTLDPRTGTPRRIDISIRTDLPEVRPRFVTNSRFLRSGAPSPSAARVVIDYRGDILTVPAENGDVLNLTQTPGAHESYPSWSPDGKTIAYFSDASGEHRLHLYDVARQQAREIAPGGTGFYAYPHWSPDSKKLAFVDNGRNLYVLDVAGGQVQKVATDALYFPGPYRELFGSWSPDSRWLAYSVLRSTNFEQAFVYDTRSQRSQAVSDGLSNVTEPTFDPTGQYLYMLASTDAGPTQNWFQQSSQDMESTNAIYLVTLRRETLSPLKRKNDRETIGTDEEAEKDEESAAAETTPVEIDFADIDQRIIDLPVPTGEYRNLVATKKGLLYIATGGEEPTLMQFSLEDRKAEPVMPADRIIPSADGKKMLFGKNGRWGVAPLGEKSDKMLKLDQLQVRIDPRAEWRNIFQEAWRVNRDYFYDPGMHGADWDAMRAKYEPFLAHVTTQDDLYRVMRWMMSELAVGHHRFSGPVPYAEGKEEVPGGLLGADYATANGRYRIAKIYGGLNWNPRLRSPLTEPGVNVAVGDYLLAVDGQPVRASDNLYRFFENKADRTVQLTVGPNADGSGSRTVAVVPVDSERALRNRDWVEGNLRYVHEATDGRVAYVYVPNTGGGGHEYFKRYFFPQVDKDAIIVDERFNGGGQIADYYIEHLTRPYQNSWTYRYGQDQHAPVAAIQGPKVLLVNEMAGSGGDLFPYLWRQADLGPIVGKTTWGGLVGVLGFPEFIDGGSVTAPNVAFWDEDGFRVENEGIEPDIDVDQLPAAISQGRDPQLDRAIEEVRKLLRENPPVTPERPPFERRVRGE